MPSFPNTFIAEFLPRIFEPLTLGSPLQLPRLRRLTLGGDLTWASNVDLPNLMALTELRLRRCRSSGNFLNGLAAIFTRSSPCLKIFELSEYASRDNFPVHRFLASFSGLQELYLVLMNSTTVPAVPSIANHGNTLTTLVLNCAPPYGGRGPVPWGPIYFPAWLQKCPKLCQLATPIPKLLAKHNTLDLKFKGAGGYLVRF